MKASNRLRSTVRPNAINKRDMTGKANGEDSIVYTLACLDFMLNTFYMRTNQRCLCNISVVYAMTVIDTSYESRYQQHSS